MGEDRVPLRDQGIPLRARGQHPPHNTTTPHSQTEAFTIHDSDSVCGIDDDEEYEPASELEGEEEDDYADRESGLEDHEDETSPLRDLGHYDQDYRDAIRPPSNLAHRAMSDGAPASENLHPGGVKRRQSFTSHLASDTPTDTPSPEANQQGRLGARWLAPDQRYATTPDALPLGNSERRAKRSNSPATYNPTGKGSHRNFGIASQAHLQVVHQQNG
jgi:hypothetical protein